MNFFQTNTDNSPDLGASSRHEQNPFGMVKLMTFESYIEPLVARATRNALLRGENRRRFLNQNPSWKPRDL